MIKYFIVLVGVIASISIARMFLYSSSDREVVIKHESTTDEAVSDSVATKDRIKQTARISQREIMFTESASLPLLGSAPLENISHTIPLEDIKRGCFRQDCIPSVDDPEFVSIEKANKILPDDTIGIALVYKGEERFYPFNMLVTREIVNDVVEGDPFLITYCPLCGTGIVFDRKVNGVAQEFGVSGMLWQSNLLMYNRAEALSDRNLWSQVLGEAVVGKNAGESLSIIPSDVARYIDWREGHQNALVLNSGRIGDPYGGEYYRVAQNFAPDYDEENSLLPPIEYVYGIEINGVYKAYPVSELPTDSITDIVNEQEIRITKTSEGVVTFINAKGELLPDIEGFYFSWVAAHPLTSVWNR